MNNETPVERLKDRLHILEFRGRMSLFYHEKRERFYTGLLNWTAFLSIIFSSFAFLFINGQLNLSAWLLGISAMVVSVMNGSILAFGMVHKSHQHAIFRGKWVAFLGEVNEQKIIASNLENIIALEKQFYNITKEEPVTVSKDIDWAHNKTIQAMGLKNA